MTHGVDVWLDDETAGDLVSLIYLLEGGSSAALDELYDELVAVGYEADHFCVAFKPIRLERND